MSETTLGSYIAAQRWSGARGERLDDAAVVARVPLRPTNVECAVVEARLAGERVCYQLWTHGDAHDALSEPAVRTSIASVMATGRTLRSDGVALVAESEGGAQTLLDAAERSTLLGAEQSNTSIVYGDRAIVKLFRRLTPGAHPDVEVTRFLTRRGFAHTPPLLATLALRDARGDSLAAMAQTFVAGAQDEWAHVVSLARETIHDEHRDDGAEARRLGEVTRALHDALASDATDADFAPRPADGATTARWAASAARSVEQGIALLRERLAAGALSALPAIARDNAAAAAAIEPADVVAVLRAAAERAAPDAGAATRHHGDYHLGQIIRAPDGTLFVIDFEGEPSRPLEERRARHSPLRDVAGMLRSFAYAAATAAFERPDDAGAAGRAAAWEKNTRTAFLGGYFGAAPAPYLPRDRANAGALLAMFELEKAFYELAYELRNRPTWVPIPLAGVARLTSAAGAA